MLVDHADAQGEGVAGIGDGMWHPVDADFAAVGGVEAIEDRHQRRFAGAVLADDAVDRAAPDAKVDVLVGVDGTEMLVDLDELDRKLIGSSGPGGPPRSYVTLSCGRAHLRPNSHARAGAVGRVVVGLDLAGDDLFSELIDL